MDRTHNWVLFGLDLQRLLSDWLLGWRELAMSLRLPVWLTPCVPIAVRFPDGSERIHAGASRDVLVGRPSPVRSRALCLPDEIVLTRRIHLPPLPKAETVSAVTLAVASNSPFLESDTVWGYRIAGPGSADPRVAIDLAIASRAQVLGALADHPPADMHASSPPEVWAQTDEGMIVMRGFGEARRERLERTHWSRLAALAALVLLLAAALLATPLLQANLQVREANQRLAALSESAAADVGARDALLQQMRQGEAVVAHLKPRLDPLGLLEHISTLVPDTAYLTSLRLERDGTVSISGLATNAAALVDTLGRDGAFTNVRTLSAISRDAATNLESFSISFLASEQAVR